MNSQNQTVVPPSNEDQYSNTDFHISNVAPKTIWVVHSPKGPHFFLTKRDAEKQYKKWKKEHLYDKNKDFEKISKPLKYILDHSKQRKYIKMNGIEAA
jgi:hypothetical protein